MQVLTPRDVPLGGLRAMTVRRTLPQRQRSLIGAWCFVDHHGPDYRREWEALLDSGDGHRFALHQDDPREALHAPALPNGRLVPRGP